MPEQLSVRLFTARQGPMIQAQQGEWACYTSGRMGARVDGLRTGWFRYTGEDG